MRGVRSPYRGQNANMYNTKLNKPKRVAAGIILGQYTSQGIVTFRTIGNQNVRYMIMVVVIIVLIIAKFKQNLSTLSPRNATSNNPV